jgi:hypothetical protein
MLTEKLPDQNQIIHRSWQKRIFQTSSVFFFLANIMYVYNAWFVRHRADDFCFSGTLREFGFSGGLRHFYLTLSNRFSAFMLWSFSDMFGEKAIRFFSMASIIFTSISIYIVIKAILDKLGVAYKNWFAFFIAQVLTFFFLYLSPSIDQSVYWRAAMVHYFLPFSALILLVYLVLKNNTNTNVKFISIALFSLINFLLAGLSESYAALQGATFSILLVFYLLHPQRNNKSSIAFYAIAAIFATAAALLVMIVSPGNTLKMTLLDQAQDVGSVITISLNSTLSFIFFTMRGKWLPFSILFLLGCALAVFTILQRQMPLNWKWLLLFILLVPMVVIFLITSIAAPTAYGMMAYPEKRVLMLALMILVLGVFSEGVLLGHFLTSMGFINQPLHVLAGIAVLLLSMYPLLAIPDISAMIRFYQARAELWDQQQQEILAQIGQGQQDLVVMALDAHAEMAEMREDSSFWVNLCTAQYYNVDTISVIER